MTKPQIVQSIKTVDELASFCKRTGFVFPSFEIYGGMAGFYDYGPRGVELKNNIKQNWWKTFVQSREDVVGVDCTTITNAKVLEASGHVANFTDILVDCKKCSYRVRADHLIEDVLKISTAGFSLEKIKDTIQKNKIYCQKCKGELTEPRKFHSMFKTSVGPVESETSIAYLRPETAPGMFTNFKSVLDSTRMKLPFGIAQVGRAYRNEIAPRDFLFRVREFEQMEIEFMAHQEKINDCRYFKEVQNKKVNILTAELQKTNKEQHIQMTIKELADKKLVKNKWHAYWLAKQYYWFIGLGINPKNLRLREHLKNELAHYASACFDIEYNFPFGWKELQGMADRAQFDLTQHQKASRQDLTYFDEETKSRVLPCVVAEPSQGVDRAFLAFLIDAYTVEKDRIVLKLHNALAPYKIAVFPLLKKDDLIIKAREVYELLKTILPTHYEAIGNIGKSYRRQDEIGTPFCITVDFDSLKKKDVTVRDRDTMRQKRVKVKELVNYIEKLLLK